ncbi:MAG: hypothetical protein JWP89_2821 [Schlesneria sp.]|nr:hypothetical protein [Schlesneria sp.]
MNHNESVTGDSDGPEADLTERRRVPRTWSPRHGRVFDRRHGHTADGETVAPEQNPINQDLVELFGEAEATTLRFTPLPVAQQLAIR